MQEGKRDQTKMAENGLCVNRRKPEGGVSCRRPAPAISPFDLPTNFSASCLCPYPRASSGQRASEAARARAQPRTGWARWLALRLPVSTTWVGPFSSGIQDAALEDVLESTAAAAESQHSPGAAPSPPPSASPPLLAGAPPPAHAPSHSPLPPL